MKRQNLKSTVSIAATNERRKFVRATLVGSALISPKSGAKAITAVLDNVNRVGAGLHTKEKLAMAQPVTVSLAFLDSDRAEQMEKLDFIRANLPVKLLVADRVEEILPKLFAAARSVAEADKEMARIPAERM